MRIPVRVVEFTDPGCPFAYSAEPHRRRLQWTFGEQLRWERRMVSLAERGEEYEAKGFTPEHQSEALADIARRHGMPIDPGRRPRMAGTAAACRAVVGARLHAPEREDALLRALRLQAMAGALLDEDATLRAAAYEAGLDPQEVVRWAREDRDVRQEAVEDAMVARHPQPSALALEHKLADWEGGRRYTCPSLELQSDDDLVAVPGFQPFDSYDVALAHLVPELERRPAPEHAEEVLRWAGEPLATQEVAAVLGTTRDEARGQLAAVADDRPLGTDALWELRAAA